MNDEGSTVGQLFDEFETILENARPFLCFTRDSVLQSEQREVVFSFKNRIKGFKYGAIQAQNEDAANGLFGIQCALNAILSELDMWLLIKDGSFYKAWDKLIDAQEYIATAMRIMTDQYEDWSKRLRSIETIVFPGYSLYSSWEVFLVGGHCSICHESLISCPHIEGRIYCGRVCVCVGQKVLTARSISFVDEPSDKRCIITEVTLDDGYFHDYMTWKKTRKDEDASPDALAKLTTKIFHGEGLEFD